MARGNTIRTKHSVGLSFERELYLAGASLVAGVDEVGRGCIAGPVVAACVILPKDLQIAGVDDSKKLSPKKRDELFDVISKEAVSFGLGVVEPDEIDRINILQASLKAMRMALFSLRTQPSHLLVDGNFIVPEISIPQRAIIGGDSLSLSIAAASIIAKVSRDRMMASMEEKYPDFSFAAHKGYGTKAHLDELRRSGPSPIHRKSFAPVAEIINRT